MATGAPERVVRIGATLGEGPVWIGREAALWFVDIKAKQVHRFDPVRATLRSWNAPGQIGWVLPMRSGGLAAGLQGRIMTFDSATGAFEPLIQVEPDLPGNRLNDATTDARGRIWFGTMDDAEDKATGRLYVLENGKYRDSGVPPVGITNGPAIAADGRTLYHTDTLGRTIYAVELHDDASIGAVRPFARIEDGAGYPDGPVVDSQGHLWTGLYGGWGVRRYAPDGRLIETVKLPTANVTKIAFGGADLRTAYATTARKGLDAAALAAQPEAGDLFAFRVDAPGQAMPEAAIGR